MVANQLARWTPEPRCSRSRSLAPPPRPRRQTGGAGDRGGECRWDAKGTGKGRLALRVPSVLSSSSLSFVGGEEKSREKERNAQKAEREGDKQAPKQRQDKGLPVNQCFLFLSSSRAPPTAAAIICQRRRGLYTHARAPDTHALPITPVPATTSTL